MVYIVTEDGADFMQNATETLKPSVLRVTASVGQEVMAMQRPFKCTCFCCPFSGQEVIERKLIHCFFLIQLFTTWLCSFQNHRDGDCHWL